MGKRVASKSSVCATSKAAAQKMTGPRTKLNYKEIKRRSIMSGLRMMKAPAASWVSIVWGTAGFGERKGGPLFSRFRQVLGNILPNKKQKIRE